MLDINAFDMFKNDSRTNTMSWLRQMPIVSYGVVVKVIDNATVKVAPVVQDSPDFLNVYDVTLIGLSSALFEVSIQPQEKDLVLLLSPNKFSLEMFSDPAVRGEDNTVIVDNTINGYTSNAIMGILASTFKAVSAVQAIVKQDGKNGPQVSLNIDATFGATFLRNASVSFASPDGKEHPVLVTVKEKRPVGINQMSSLTVRVGFDGTDEDNPVDSGTTVERSKKAPYTLTTEAPVEETFKEGATVTENYYSPVSHNFKQDAPYKVTSETHVDIDSKEPIGLNGGLRKSALKPYWDAEKSAADSLFRAANQALMQMAILDGMSGGLSFFASLGKELAAFAKALSSADASANSASEPIVK